MARAETRFGATSSLGTTYTLLGTVGAGETWNILLNVTNRHASSSSNFQAFVAASGWTTGEPAGATLVAAIAYNQAVAPGGVFQVTGVVLNTGEKLVVYSSVASALDVIASGVKIT